MSHKQSLTNLALLAKGGIILPNLFNRNTFCAHSSVALLHAVDVVDEVLGTIRPGVSACTILLSILPNAVEAFAIRIVESTRPIALVELELTDVRLAIGPEVGSLTLLLAHVEITEVKAAVRPLEQALTMHSIVDERSLIDLATRADCAPKAINLPFLEVPFEECVTRIDLEAHSIWLECLHAELSTELCTAPTIFEIHLELTLSVHIIVGIMVQVVVERAQDFVDILDNLVLNVSHDVVVVGEGELMAELYDVSIEPLS